jgi:hypothetical protein
MPGHHTRCELAPDDPAAAQAELLLAEAGDLSHGWCCH